MGRLTLAFVLACSLAAGLGGCAATQAGSQPDAQAATDAPKEAYSVQVKTIKTADGLIYGRLYVPNSPASGNPVAIVSHGIGSSCEETAADAERLASTGITAYVFDFRSGSMRSKSDALTSDGAMVGMSVLTERDDLEAVMDALIADGTAEAGRLFLMGESQGGLVSALTAADRPDEVAGLVLFYPAFVIPDNCRAEYSSLQEVPDDAKVFGMTVGRRYYADVLDMDVWDAISGYEGPVLLVHGDADQLVPAGYSRKASEVYRNATLHILSGAGHGFKDDDLDRACTWAAELVTSR